MDGRSRQRGASGRARLVGRTDEGIALLDVVVALSVLSLSLLAMGFGLDVQTGNVESATNQQVAGQLLNRALGQVDALPYSVVEAGLSTGDTTIATDPNISGVCTATGNTCTFNPGSGAETILATSLSTTQAPLNPHLVTTSEDGKSFTVATYPTEYMNTTSPSIVRVTVVVSWSGGSVDRVSGTSKISGQVLVSSLGAP